MAVLAQSIGGHGAVSGLQCLTCKLLLPRVDAGTSIVSGGAVTRGSLSAAAFQALLDLASHPCWRGKTLTVAANGDVTG